MHRGVIVVGVGLVAVAASAASAGQAATVKAPTGLTVAAATSTAASLTWTAGAPGTRFVVERKTLGAPWPAAGAPSAPPKPTAAAVATVDAAKADDSGLDPFTTYVYRVRAVGAGEAVSTPSNEVTMGPPPVGFSQVLPMPAAMLAHDRNAFAAVMRMALDGNGDPAFAYLVSDPDGDGDPADSHIQFVSWSRARYRWNAPVTLDVVGDVVREAARSPLSLARDASSNRWAVAYMVGGHELKIAASTDGGATWTSTRVERPSDEDAGISTPALALAGAQTYLAYALGGPGVRFRSGPSTAAPETWSKALAPSLPGTSEARTEGIAVALDAAGKPLVSYLLNPADGYNLTLAVWRPGSTAAVKVLDTNGKQTDGPAAELVAAGSQLAVIFYGNRDEEFFNNHHVWFTHSADGGATWAPVAVLADDGGHAMVAPISVTIDRSGHFAAAADLGGGNQDGVKCGVPNLMRSSTGAQWTTCAPATKGLTAADPGFPLVAFAGNDRIYEVFRTRQPAAGLQPGLVLWREP